MKSKFNESVAKIKRERFRDLAVQHGAWPDSNSEALFDEAVNGLKRKRDHDYAGELFKKYDSQFAAKVVGWAQVEFSPLEIEKFKSFEELSAAFIDANKQNPDMVSSEEIAQFFDVKSGRIKKTLESPEERPLDLNNLEVDEQGNLYEKPPAPKVKVQPKTPDINEARRMTSSELAAILPKGD